MSDLQYSFRRGPRSKEAPWPDYWQTADGLLHLGKKVKLCIHLSNTGLTGEALGLRVQSKAFLGGDGRGILVQIQDVKWSFFGSEEDRSFEYEFTLIRPGKHRVTLSTDQPGWRAQTTGGSTDRFEIDVVPPAIEITALEVGGRPVGEGQPLWLSSDPAARLRVTVALAARPTAGADGAHLKLRCTLADGEPVGVVIPVPGSYDAEATAREELAIARSGDGEITLVKDEEAERRYGRTCAWTLAAHRRPLKVRRLPRVGFAPGAGDGAHAFGEPIELALAVDCDAELRGAPSYSLEVPPGCDVEPKQAPALRAGEKATRTVKVTPRVAGDLKVAIRYDADCEPWRDGQHLEQVTLRVEPPKVLLVEGSVGGPYAPGAEVEPKLYLNHTPATPVRVELTLSPGGDPAAATLTFPADHPAGEPLASRLALGGAGRATLRWAIGADEAGKTELEVEAPRVLLVEGSLLGPFRPGAAIEPAFSVDRRPWAELRVDVKLSPGGAPAAASLTFPGTQAPGDPLACKLALGGVGRALLSWEVGGEKQGEVALTVRSAANPQGDADECAVADLQVVDATKKAAAGWVRTLGRLFRLPESDSRGMQRLLDDMTFASYQADYLSTIKTAEANYDISTVAGPVWDWARSRGANLNPADLVGLPVDGRVGEAVGAAVERGRAEAGRVAAEAKTASGPMEVKTGLVTREFVEHHLRRRHRAAAAGDDGPCRICGRYPSDHEGREQDPVQRLASARVEESLGEVVEALVIADRLRLELLRDGDTSWDLLEEKELAGLDEWEVTEEDDSDWLIVSQKPGAGAKAPRKQPDYGKLKDLAQHVGSCSEVVALLHRLFELEYQVCRLEANVAPLLVLVEAVAAKVEIWHQATEAIRDPRTTGLLGGLLGQLRRSIDDHEPGRKPQGALRAGDRCEKHTHCYGQVKRFLRDPEPARPVTIKLPGGFRNILGLQFEKLTGLAPSKVEGRLEEARGAKSKATRDPSARVRAIRILLSDEEQRLDQEQAAASAAPAPEARCARWELLVADVRHSVRHRRTLWQELQELLDAYSSEEKLAEVKKVLDRASQLADALMKAGGFAFEVGKFASDLAPYARWVLKAVAVGKGIFKLGKRAYERGAFQDERQRKMDEHDQKEEPDPNTQAGLAHFVEELELNKGLAIYWVRGIKVHLDGAGQNFDRLQYYGLMAREDIQKHGRWLPGCDDAVGFVWAYDKVIKHGNKVGQYTLPLARILDRLLTKLVEYDTFWREGAEPLLQELEKRISDPEFHAKSAGRAIACPAPAGVPVQRSGEEAGHGNAIRVPRPDAISICYGPASGKREDDKPVKRMALPLSLKEKVDKLLKQMQAAEDRADEAVEKVGAARKKVDEAMEQFEEKEEYVRKFFEHIKAASDQLGDALKAARS